MKDVQISDMLEEMLEKRINSEKFGEIFQIDGIPLWYFLNPLIRSQYLPTPFKAQWEIEKDVENDTSLSSLDKLKFNLSAFAVRKGLAFNEKIKLIISQSDGKNSSGTGNKDVLFTTTTDQVTEKNGKLEFLEFGRTVDSLKKRKKVKPLILICDPFSRNSFFKLKRYSPLLYDHITPKILEESKQLSDKLNEKWKTLDEKSKIKLFAYRGKNYWKFFDNDMNFLFSRELLFTLIKYYLTFKEIIEKHDIKVVYLTGLVGFYELSALGAAYKLDRRVVYSTHGRPGSVGGENPEFMKIVFFAASRDKDKKTFLKGGIEKENIAITGPSFLDEIIIYRRKRRSKAKKTVVLLTTAVVEGRFMEKKEYFEFIRKRLSQIKDVEEVERTIIRLHPREKHKSEYKSIVKQLSMENVKIEQESSKKSLYSTINESDLVIGFVSTALDEAMILGKDTFHLDEFLNESIGTVQCREGALCVKKGDNLTEMIRKVLKDEGLRKRLKIRREKYLRESFYKLDGKAHVRIARLIEKVSLKNR